MKIRGSGRPVVSRSGGPARPSLRAELRAQKGSEPVLQNFLGKSRVAHFLRLGGTFFLDTGFKGKVDSGPLGGTGHDKLIVNRR